MKSSMTLTRFFGRTALCFLVLMVVWMQVSKWTSYPAASLAQIVLDSQAEAWVESTQNLPGLLRVKTKFRTVLSGKQVAVPIAVVEPAHYAFGTILFFSLLFASRSRNFIGRAISGYGILLIPQAFSLLFVLLGQIYRGVPIETLGIAPWQGDAIMLNNALGMMALPTLAPVALWLWLEQDFFLSLTGIGKNAVP